MRRRILLLGLLLALAGCQNVSGPLGYRSVNRANGLSIEEQQSRSRLRYSYINDDRLTPKAYVDRPDPSYNRN